MLKLTYTSPKGTIPVNDGEIITHGNGNSEQTFTADDTVKYVNKIKPEIEDMENYIRQDLENKNLTEEDIFRINEKIKDLEKQIANVVEG